MAFHPTRNDGVASLAETIMRGLWDKYIGEIGLTFQPSMIVDCSLKRHGDTIYVRGWGFIGPSPCTHYLYRHQGIEIEYHKRCTFHLDDYDEFTLTRVVKNGVVICSIDM